MTSVKACIATHEDGVTRPDHVVERAQRLVHVRRPARGDARCALDYASLDAPAAPLAEDLGDNAEEEEELDFALI